MNSDKRGLLTLVLVVANFGILIVSTVSDIFEHRNTQERIVAREEWGVEMQEVSRKLYRASEDRWIELMERVRNIEKKVDALEK